jgi:hypothetical protein
MGMIRRRRMKLIEEGRAAAGICKKGDYGCMRPNGIVGMCSMHEKEFKGDVERKFY